MKQEFDPAPTARHRSQSPASHWQARRATQPPAHPASSPSSGHRQCAQRLRQKALRRPRLAHQHLARRSRQSSRIPRAQQRKLAMYLGDKGVRRRCRHRRASDDRPAQQARCDLGHTQRAGLVREQEQPINANKGLPIPRQARQKMRCLFSACVVTASTTFAMRLPPQKSPAKRAPCRAPKAIQGLRPEDG